MEKARIKKMRVFLSYLLLCPMSFLFFLFIGCGGGGASDDHVVVIASSAFIKAEQGGRVGPFDNAHILIPQAALSQDTQIILEAGQDIPFPGSFTKGGPALKAEPDGLIFERNAVIAVPVDPEFFQNEDQLDQLVVFRQESNGEIAPLPVLSVDKDALLAFVATPGFTTFQVAVPEGDFAIVPQTSFQAEEGVGLNRTLETTGGIGLVTFQLESAMKIDGIQTSDAVLLENEVAPGVTLSSTGLLSGTPSERGTFTFSILATDSTSLAPQTAVISLSLTVVSSQVVSLEASGGARQELLQLKYDDQDNLYTLARIGAAHILSKHPSESSQNLISTTVNVGAHPFFDVSPDGKALALAYQRVVGLSLNFPMSDLQQAIDAGGDGSVDGLSFDLSGDGNQDLEVSFTTESESDFTGSDADLRALANALNAEFLNLGLGLRALANHTLNGVSIIDDGLGIIHASGAFVGIRSSGDGLGLAGILDQGGKPEHQIIEVVEYDENLTLSAGPFRVDEDFVFDPEQPDNTLSRFFNQSLRPVLAFALDRTPLSQAEEEREEEDEQEEEAEIESYPYCVSYERLRNLALDGGFL